MSVMKYGIDLGTTNSCIASMESDGVRIYQNREQMNVTPSAVQMLRSGRLIVGAKAYDAMLDDAANVAVEFKRWMGQADTFTFPSTGRAFQAEELSAEVLKALKENVQTKTHENVAAAVITVPAAFTTLQCEATDKAAKLAGIDECFLLQEPIAAALAYGIKPGVRDQRWLVFDLGGGTLDVVVVSTRDGRLTVLEHGGRNLHGGKDIDRLIVDRFYLPALRSVGPLPTGAAFDRLHRALTRKAERDKIALSTTDEVVVYFDDLERHLTGEALDLTLTFKRSELETAVAPFVDKAVALTEEVLYRAKLAGSDLDRVLLVGGPTQMPIVRDALRSRISAAIDTSVDPMTAVAQGAAVYASTVETAAAPAYGLLETGTPTVRLEYERICSAEACPVYGRVEHHGVTPITEVQIGSDDGFWNSGWVPLQNGAFEVEVRLQQARRNRFVLAGRDRSGRIISVEPASFVIDHGLVPTAPPLPYSIGLEVVRPNGAEAFDAVFKRGTPLPLERTVKYTARETLRPDEPDGRVAIKFWEGEHESPRANHWLANVYVRATQLQRPLPAGSELELTIKVDQSRRLSVDIFIPRLNLHLSEGVYISQESHENTDALPEAFAGYAARIDDVDEVILANAELDDLREEAEQVREALLDLEVELSVDQPLAQSVDPDLRVRLDERLREALAKLYTLERKAGIVAEAGSAAPDSMELAETVVAIAERHGTALEQREADLLKGDLERGMAKQEPRSIQKATEALNRLRWRILFRLPETWYGAFAYLRRSNVRFIDQTEANRWLDAGNSALEAEDSERVKEAVVHLWELQPPSEAEKAREQAVRTGLQRP